MHGTDAMARDSQGCRLQDQYGQSNMILRSMMKLQTKLALFNLLSKLVFSALFIGFLPLIIERINTLQTDNELIDKREEVISLISEIGIEPFITSETETGFGSYNILKEEFISLERIDLEEDWNFIEVATRIMDEETIDYRVLNYSLKIDGQTYLLEIGKSLSSIRYAAKNIRKVILLFLAFFIAVTLLSDLLYTARILTAAEDYYPEARDNIITFSC